MYVQPCCFQCNKCGTNSRKNNGHALGAHRGGFFQPAHHRPSGEDGDQGRAGTGDHKASAVEQHSGPRTQNCAQLVRRSPERNQENDNTSDRITDQTNAPPDSHKSSRSIEPHHSVEISMKALKRQDISVVFNESSIILTKPMETLLNRGLKFTILPLKLDITQTLVEFRKF